MQNTRKNTLRYIVGPRCKYCGVEYERWELNRRGHCHHCADELGERHPFFSGDFHEQQDGER